MTLASVTSNILSVVDALLGYACVGRTVVILHFVCCSCFFQSNTLISTDFADIVLFNPYWALSAGRLMLAETVNTACTGFTSSHLVVFLVMGFTAVPAQLIRLFALF